ncbi:Wzz/FepE/Etk N-terminal domain-containing protein [Polaribacter sp. PL03]|nr:Wzz/FepE/Etk N-terminal domain-containing protein [Polaribacter sp. PL03]
MNQEKIKNPIEKSNMEYKIDLLAFAKTTWAGRKIVIKYILIFMAIGLFIAIFSKKEYTASVTIVPATEGKSISGNLSGLAAMAGVNLGGLSGKSGISPTLYPQVTSSISFQKELLLLPLTFEGHNSAITYKDYYMNYSSPGVLGYLKKYTIGLPRLILKKIKGNPNANSTVISVKGGLQIESLTEDENILLKQLSSQLKLDINAKDGYIKLSMKMPEPLAAAEMTQKAQLSLQKYIINFKVQKSVEKLKFINERFIEKEKKFKFSQKQLARFQDQNQFVNSAQAKTKLMGLQTDFNLAYDVYSELAKELESQKIQVKEDTPVFTIIKPVSIPFERSKPKRIIILFIWTFLGIIIGVGMVFRKPFFYSLKEKWNK